jgi:hypothetical protein
MRIKVRCPDPGTRKRERARGKMTPQQIAHNFFRLLKTEPSRFGRHLVSYCAKSKAAKTVKGSRTRAVAVRPGSERRGGAEPRREGGEWHDGVTSPARWGVASRFPVMPEDGGTLLFSTWAAYLVRLVWASLLGLSLDDGEMRPSQRSVRCRGQYTGETSR